MRKSRLEIIKEQRRGTVKQQALDEAGFVQLILGGPPLPTQQSFIEDYAEDVDGDDRGWEAAYMGPYGCAKTSTILCKAWLQALYEPGSQILIARANFNDLKDTTYKRMEEMLQRLPPGTLVERSKDSPMKWVVQPIGDGAEFSTFTFMGLQDGLGSYEFHSAFLDEADEISKERVNNVRGRCRLKGHSRMVALAFNPPSEDHWLYTECTGLNNKGRKVQEPGFRLFQPQPLENAVNVRAGYYEELRKRYPPDMVRRLVDGQWGSTFVGQGVYSSEFRRATHVRDLEYDNSLPLYRFWDFGYRFPVCLWAQVTDEGQLRVLREEMGREIEIRPFAQHCKRLTNQFYDHRDNAIVDFGDPAANQRKDTGSTLAHLLQEGITLRSRSSHIDEGVRQVRLLLSKLAAGEPAFLIAPDCPITIRALEGGYHYPDEETKTNPLKPVKDNYYDHPMDALRYGIINIFGVATGDRMEVDVTNLPTSVAMGEYAGMPYFGDTSHES